MSTTEEARTPGEVHTIPVPIKLVEKARTLTWSVSGDAYLGKEPEAELATEVDAGLLAAQRAAQAAPTPSSPGVPDSVREVLLLARATLNAATDALDGAAKREKVPDRSLKLLATSQDCELAASAVRALIAAQPAGQAGDAGIAVDVQTMRASNGTDYYVRIACNGREVTPHSFKERWKAEYEAAHYAWIFGLRADEPSILAYDAESHPNAPAPDSTRTGAAESLREAIEELSAAVTAAHDDYMSFGRYEGWNRINTAEQALCRLLEPALAARPEAPSDAGWRDISTAPKDGSYVLGYGPHESRGHYVDAISYWQDGWPIRFMHGFGEPTHWMPLPTPPSDPAPSGQAEG
ncbi:DUF551 domain-containing protein [Methylorubrum extorquens]|uniref:DUF551 domain-containing protein n=1 Tax=Methylorubrum extorquens TaxID=408 RepID=UPI0022383A11|nr:DUF551 domain-containing protein [Methylorubrum extorquens]UYW33673.1 DUF551 domain-containing protein [Methylorubrum extorquens]